MWKNGIILLNAWLSFDNNKDNNILFFFIDTGIYAIFQQFFAVLSFKPLRWNTEILIDWHFHQI